jgi:hypothetical protein
LYVWQASPTPTPPYTNWTTAAHTIQAAVDGAIGGDKIVVTNGVYATGGRAMVGAMTNRVVVDRAVTVRSVNGPEVTVIQGCQVPETSTGNGAIRCVYLINGAVLSGFTLTNGATFYSEDYAREHSGGGVWCESPNALVTNCTLTGNSSSEFGGGAYSGTLNHCTLKGNSASGDGGGASWSTLNHCTLTGNSSDDSGGGAAGSTLNNCTVYDNKTKHFGGGANESTLFNCTVTRNSCRYGGGVAGGTNYNCIVYHNRAPVGPNYLRSAFHHSCTTPLPLDGLGNIGSDPQLASWTHLSSTSPCLGAGVVISNANVDIDGQAWGTSPCIGADQLTPGTATGPVTVTVKAYLTNLTTGYEATFRALEVEGQTTGNRWDFGDGTRLTNRLEVVHAWSAPGTYPMRFTVFNDSNPGGITATVAVQVLPPQVFYVNPGNASPAFPYTNWAKAATTIQQAIGAGFAAGRVVLVTNGLYHVGGIAMSGKMTNRVALTNGVVVRSVNGPTVTILRGAPTAGGTNGTGSIRCAYVDDGCLLDGFTLTNGHTRISGGTSREQGGGGAWCERTGGVTNCTFVGNEAFRDGGGANGGIYSACTFRDNRAGDDSGGVDDAVLYDCILTGNQSNWRGGGASESTLNNCTLTGNSALWSGGGACWSTLNNCTLTGNSAIRGGGASDSTLNNCTLTGNSVTGVNAFGGGTYYSSLYNCTLTANSAALDGGGAYASTLNNCILYYNTAATNPNYSGGALNYCCTTPAPTNGAGNIIAEPLFVDRLNGNVRLQSNSPCINAGNNIYVTGSTDLDGRLRIVAGTVDIGVYEFPSPLSVISYAWLQQYGLPTDGSADTADPDGDRLNNWQEWHCGTDPTNALSVLRLLPPVPMGKDAIVRWQSVSNRVYFLERSTNLAASPSFLPLATNLTGQAGSTAYTVTNSASEPPSFYRVGVPAP